MRKYYLDNLRYFIIFLVLVFHVILVNEFYPTLPGYNFGLLNGMSAFIYPWFMFCLFMVSGMVSRYYLETHDLKSYYKSRTLKLLVPSTLGLMVFHFLLGGMNMILSGASEELASTPLIMKWFIMVLSGTGPLWFIQVLWLCSLLLVLIIKLEKGRILKTFSKFSYLGLLILFPIYLVIWLVSKDRILSTYRVLIDIFSFMIGYFILSHDKLTCKLAKKSDILMIISSLVGLVYSFTYYDSEFIKEPIVSNLFSGCYSFLMSITMIGFFKKHFDKESKYHDFLSKFSYPYYIFHYFSMVLVLYIGYKLNYYNLYLNFLLVTVSGFTLPLVLAKLVRLVPILDKIILGEK